MSKMVRLALAVACLGGLFLFGCGGSTGLIGVNPPDYSVLASLANIPGLEALANMVGLNTSDVASMVAGQTVQIDVVNQTTYTASLVISVDGQAKTLSCPAGMSSRFQIAPCPGEVRLISENWLDADENIVGGRDYAGVDTYSFLAGSFKCGATLVWTLTPTAARAQAL